MVQIIQEKRRPKFSEQLGEGIARGAKEAATGIPDLMAQKKENKYLSDLTGLDFDAIQDPGTRKIFLQNFVKKKEEDTQKFSTGLDILSKMRNIAAKRNIGRGSAISGLFPGETAKDRSEFAQLGTALIPLVAAGVPIRNQKEFEQYKKVITDPSSPLSEIEGALNGLESIFQGKLSPESRETEKKLKKTKFNIGNPEHKAKRDQVLKKFKGNRKKAEEVLSREFEL